MTLLPSPTHPEFSKVGSLSCPQVGYRQEVGVETRGRKLPGSAVHEGWGSQSPQGQALWDLLAFCWCSQLLSMRIQSARLGWGGRRTGSLEGLQVFGVLNFIRSECVIVKVKSRDMTALSKSNVEKIRAVRDQSKTGSGHRLGRKPAGRGRLLCSLQTLPLENKSPALSFGLANGILSYVPQASVFNFS